MLHSTLLYLEHRVRKLSKDQTLIFTSLALPKKVTFTSADGASKFLPIEQTKT